MEGYIGKSLLPLIHITDSTANGVKTNYGSSALKLTKQKVILAENHTWEGKDLMCTFDLQGK